MKRALSSAGVLSTMLFVLAAPTVVAQSEQTKLPPMTGATPDLRYQEQIPPKIGIPPNDEIDKVVYTLGAQISGRSRLILDDGTAQWHHYDFAAPGRENCEIGDVWGATMIDGAMWFPVWPDPDCENYFCDCDSDVFTGLKPVVPNQTMGVELQNFQGRGTVTIVEYPTRANGFRVAIEFDDNRWLGAAWYQVDLVLWFAVQEVFCISNPNSSGKVATLEMMGSMSVTRNDVSLCSDNAPAGKFGQFFYGVQPAHMPFGDGVLCVSPFQPGLIRLPRLAHIDATGEAILPIDFTGVGSRGAIQPGQYFYFQFWFRDAKEGGSGFNLSNGVKARFTP
jgi:hypothetical protein